jgi:hypothetical protein
LCAHQNSSGINPLQSLLPPSAPRKSWGTAGHREKFGHNAPVLSSFSSASSIWGIDRLRRSVRRIPKPLRADDLSISISPLTRCPVFDRVTGPLHRETHDCRGHVFLSATAQRASHAPASSPSDAARVIRPRFHFLEGNAVKPAPAERTRAGAPTNSVLIAPVAARWIARSNGGIEISLIIQRFQGQYRAPRCLIIAPSPATPSASQRRGIRRRPKS